MIIPYSGETLEIFRKAFPFSTYVINKSYKNSFGRYVYLNSKGFLHLLRPCKLKQDGKVVAYEINDYLLKKDGMLKLSYTYGLFHSREDCIKEIENFHIL